jgi:hypothetical protein
MIAETVGFSCAAAWKPPRSAITRCVSGSPADQRRRVITLAVTQAVLRFTGRTRRLRHAYAHLRHRFR